MARGAQTGAYQARRCSLKLIVTPLEGYPSATYHHPTSFKRRKPRRGTVEEMEIPPDIKFDSTINKKSTDGVEAPNWGVMGLVHRITETIVTSFVHEVLEAPPTGLAHRISEATATGLVH